MCIFIQWDFFFLLTACKTFPPSYLPSGNLARTSNVIFPKLNLAFHFPNLSCVLCSLFLVTASCLLGSTLLTSLCIPLASKDQKVNLFALLKRPASSLTPLCLTSGTHVLYLGMFNNLLIHPPKLHSLPSIPSYTLLPPDSSFGIWSSDSPDPLKNLAQLQFAESSGFICGPPNEILSRNSSMSTR